MTRLPNRFQEEFDEKGDTFFEIAEFLYTNHGHQYTLDDLTENVGVTKAQVSNLVNDMADGEEEWINKTEGQMTIIWNTETYNPASTETTHAVRGFYRDLWLLLKAHQSTAPGTYVILGFFLFATSVVMASFYIGFSLSAQNSGIPPGTYVVLTVGSLITGVFATAMSWIQAYTNSVIWPRLPSDIFENDD
ncbi:hypothetical protein [Haloplanus rubicundus]|uniref:Uncharacterized protein n=1 Tax=Haloplanus rubicundus TaxID=1547898 RepID=A0A345EIF0_9EURY|nr:hypothetical protein [Haloplanus rubicundus]AXG11972.1 hypothetical protein DU484_18875 [Haloplanus rubicundus]